MIKDILKGKSLGRILMNNYCQKYLSGLEGKIIDFGGGGSPSYYKYFNNEVEIIRTDYDGSKQPDLIVDLNEPFPIETDSFQTAILFNTLYILDRPQESIKEIKRVLKKDGKLYLTVPLIFNEAPEPVDYWRFTSMGIKKVLSEAGFKNIELHKIGERFSSAISLANPFRKLKYLNLVFYPMALFLDWVLPNKIKEKHPCPLGYFIICKK